jgi:hypothetical protein
MRSDNRRMKLQDGVRSVMRVPQPTNEIPDEGKERYEGLTTDAWSCPGRVRSVMWSHNRRMKLPGEDNERYAVPQPTHEAPRGG